MESELLQGQFLEAWEIHARISLYLLDAIPPVALGDRSASKGRTVGEQFAHVHNIRYVNDSAADPSTARCCRIKFPENNFPGSRT